ncbi:hypothetical protein G4V62_16400 [Bacillaceae bacterium SIJ1]|uniref:hypothetical protein n=1 Tax=Litoribacterium kuwaitense TaxID=1398745 RepID=UPI0013EB2B8F|nr:hypothetical protein [Litoribacterium kuwaitense]NGP46451.1 hypothetical protein [Litoribacterium kuwaitense]
MRLPASVQRAQKTKRIIHQNLVFSLAVIGTLVVTNVFYGIDLPLGVVGHEGSTLLVIGNGLRLLKYNSQKQNHPPECDDCPLMKLKEAKA